MRRFPLYFMVVTPAAALKEPDPVIRFLWKRGGPALCLGSCQFLMLVPNSRNAPSATCLDTSVANV